METAVKTYLATDWHFLKVFIFQFSRNEIQGICNILVASSFKFELVEEVFCYRIQLFSFLCSDQATVYILHSGFSDGYFLNEWHLYFFIAWKL